MIQKHNRKRCISILKVSKKDNKWCIKTPKQIVVEIVDSSSSSEDSLEIYNNSNNTLALAKTKSCLYKHQSTKAVNHSEAKKDRSPSFAMNAIDQFIVP